MTLTDKQITLLYKVATYFEFKFDMFKDIHGNYSN